MENITGYTRLLGVLADPIKHSSSPIMMNHAFKKLQIDNVYVAFEVKEEKFDEAVAGLKAIDVLGFNVSMPYKERIMAKLDVIDESAQLVGAVNTVVNQNGIWHGYNTDGYGFVAGANDMGWDIAGKKVVILGAGGASNAIVCQCALSNASQVVVFNRPGKNFDAMAQRAEKLNQAYRTMIQVKDLNDLGLLKQELEDAYLLVNATSVGMGQNQGHSPIPDASYFNPNLKVMDIIYHPLLTRLLEQAQQAGLEYCNGKRMVMFQGARAFEYWTGQKMPTDYIKTVLGIE